MPTDKRELENHWDPVARHYQRYCGSQRWYGQGYGDRRRTSHFLVAGILAVVCLLAVAVGAV